MAVRSRIEQRGLGFGKNVGKKQKFLKQKKPSSATAFKSFNKFYLLFLSAQPFRQLVFIARIKQGLDHFGELNAIAAFYILI
jgi:hypothetical protein